MSRRFGRNQRRRAREAQAALQAENDALLGEIDSLRDMMAADRQLLCEQGEKIRAADDFTRKVGNLVGRRSIIAGEPPRIRIRMPIADALVFGFLMDQPRLAFPRLLDDSSVIGDIRAQVLRVLDVRAAADYFSRMVHIEAELDNQKVRYAVSDEMLHELNAQELAEIISRPLIQMLAQVVKEAKR